MTNFDHIAKLQSLQGTLQTCDFSQKLGYVTAVGSTTLKAKFDRLGLGAICRLASGDAEGMLVEVIALEGPIATLSVLGDASRIRIEDRVEFVSDSLEFEFHNQLLGAVLDGVGRPLQGGKATGAVMRRRALGDSTVPAMARPLISKRFQTGVNAVDGFLSLGQGQRIALFGPPGCGKSMLLASIVSQCKADVVVMALVGERGREVQEFLQRHIPNDIRARTVVVAATSDRPALERVYATHVASSIAEAYRDQGKNVLLLVDSLTRVARALREIGLAAGEPAVRRGFPASVYPALPKIIERAGRSEQGDITAIYAVLVEGDSASDPIADEIKSLTDGHIELSRDHAAAGRFPAIDILKSLSRVMPEIVSKEHMALANKGRRLFAKYEELKLLIQIGEFEIGRDSVADEAVSKINPLRSFVHNGTADQSVPVRAVVSEMRKVIGR